MGVNFTPQENCVVFALLEENDTDILIKTDRDGFIVEAAPTLDRIGLSLAGGPIGRHLLDFVDPSGAEAVRVAHNAAISGRPGGSLVEFPARGDDGQCRWFELRTRHLADERDRIYGAVSIMRCIEERRSFEARLFAATMTDPLTGLTNRRAFVAMLRHLVGHGASGSVALFDIDHFKALNLRHGQTAGDEVLAGFARLLRTLSRAEDIISRTGGESFAVLMPDTSPEQAGVLCREIVQTLAEIGRASEGEAAAITSSAGVARIGETLDETIRAAELALTIAKAKGRNRVELAGADLRLVNGGTSRRTQQYQAALRVTQEGDSQSHGMT